MIELTIKEVSTMYNISADTLRYYEKIGLIDPVKRNENGIRDYKEIDLKRIQFLKLNAIFISFTLNDFCFI